VAGGLRGDASAGERDGSAEHPGNSRPRGYYDDGDLFARRDGRERSGGRESAGCGDGIMDCGSRKSLRIRGSSRVKPRDRMFYVWTMEEAGRRHGSPIGAGCPEGAGVAGSRERADGDDLYPCSE